MSVPGPDPSPIPADPRALLSDVEFAGVAATVMDANIGMAHALADRIVTDALAFVATCARYPEEPIAPSPVVDEGWHALILHTDLYARLCARLGRFVHHYPQRPEPSGYQPTVTEHTIATLAQAGYQADMELWQSPVDNRVTVGARTWHTPPGGCGPIVIKKEPKKPKPQNASHA